MKTKKVIILTLIFIFTFSNVGLPFTLHICSAMKTIGLEKCEMCQEAEFSSHSCCENSIPNNVQKIKSDKSCCESKSLASPIKDEYLAVEKSLGKIEFKIIHQIDLQFEKSTNKLFVSKYNYNSSSPPLYENNIYLTNSSFLI